jgi:hypothetical protein
MNADRDTLLRAYLENHYAGSVPAVALLNDAQGRWPHSDLRPFFDALRREVEEDQAVLHDVLDRLSGKPSPLKNVGAAASEKLLTLRQRATDERLGLVETLETLLLGVRGKRALWAVLEDLADSRLAGVDFGALGQRAEAQLDRIEPRRRAAARAAFASIGG